MALSSRPMPTNVLRSRAKPAAGRAVPLATGPRVRRVVITAGRIRIRAEVLDTPTAARVVAALPLYSTAETWGEAIHFEVPVSSGRERGARINTAPGDICFWSEDDRVIVGFGPTPISRPGEIRMPQPCNVWARALDDVALLKSVRPGEKVTLTASTD